jgi:hypothetical protein
VASQYDYISRRYYGREKRDQKFRKQGNSDIAAKQVVQKKDGYQGRNDHRHPKIAFKTKRMTRCLCPGAAIRIDQ